LGIFGQNPETMPQWLGFRFANGNKWGQEVMEGWGELNEVVALVWVAVEYCELERGLGAKGSKPSTPAQF